jgi:ribonuclease PH
VEVQVTAERRPFSEQELVGLLALARGGTAELVTMQRQVLGIV